MSVKKEALEQLRAGAHILDVNMGVPGIDQAYAMQHVIHYQCLSMPLSLSIRQIPLP